jgi:putative two-component system response regulator
LKILIVDDELVSRKTLQKLLGSIGECEVAENGKDALAIAMSDTPPDLVLLDIIMPEMDGFEVCRRLKADPGLKDVPVIFLSANAAIEDITGLSQNGSKGKSRDPSLPEENAVRSPRKEPGA